MELIHILDALRAEMARRHLTQRQVERQLGYGTGYLSQVLGGRLDLKMKVFLDLLEVLRISPVDFFAELDADEVAGSRTESESLVSPDTLQKVAELLEEAGRQARALTRGAKAPGSRREEGGGVG